jgi:hypothetical protein
VFKCNYKVTHANVQAIDRIDYIHIQFSGAQRYLRKGGRVLFFYSNVARYVSYEVTDVLSTFNQHALDIFIYIYVYTIHTHYLQLDTA